MVYFLQPVNGGPIKIGHSHDVDGRRRSLEMRYGQPLALLCMRDGGRVEERSIHERFAHLRLGRTEQFRPAPELLDFIGRPLLVSPNPDAIEAMLPRKESETAVVIRGSMEWKDWLDAAAVHCRLRIPSLVDLALVDYARKMGFREPPKR